MIKDYVARAMQISMLEGDQLSRLHELEKKTGTLLANWNIQMLFGLPEIKYTHSIPEDDSAQIQHARRIDNEIETLGLKTTEPYESKMDWWHMFDFNVFHAKDRIIWEYSGAGKRGNIKEMLRGAVVLVSLAVLVR